jgi:hypothetical protein
VKNLRFAKVKSVGDCPQRSCLSASALHTALNAGLTVKEVGDSLNGVNLETLIWVEFEFH